MNYIKLFAKGGKIDTKAIKAEIARIFMLEDSPEKVEQLWQDAVNTYGSEEGVLSEIFKQVGDNPSDESVQKAMMNVLNYTPMEESRIFKCGGKLQQLVTKFGKGGGVDCGCGGIKLDGGGEVINGEYNSDDFVKNESRSGWTKVPMPDGRLGYARNYRGPVFRWFGPKSNTLTQILVSEDPEDGAFRHSTREISNFFSKNPKAKLDTSYTLFNGLTPNTKTIEIMNKALEGVAPERPQSKQEGGTVELTPLPGHDVDTRLTRRQARDLAALNQGYNGEQFQYAMDNAVNALRKQGLRGRELRERAREMAAGITPAERTITINTPSTNLNTFDFNANKALPTYTNTATNVTRSFGDASTIREGDLRPVTPQKRKKQGVITVGPLTDGSRYYTNYVQKGNEPIYSYYEFRHELPETQVIGNKSGYTRKGNEPVYGYDDFVHELPNTYVIANKSGYIQKDTNPIYSYYDFNHELPETTITPKNGILLPEVIKYGYRNVQTPVPVYRKQGGQIEKDITNSLKCGGKTKKKK